MRKLQPVVMQCRYCGGSEPSDDCAACGQSCQMVPYDGPRVAEEKPKATPMTAEELAGKITDRLHPEVHQGWYGIHDPLACPGPCATYAIVKALITAYDAARDAEAIERMGLTSTSLDAAIDHANNVQADYAARIRELEAQVAEKDAAPESKKESR